MSKSDPRILKICSRSKALPQDALSGAVSAYGQNGSNYLHQIFVETRDGKACMPLDALSGAASAYDQNCSNYLHQIFVETRGGKACMSLVVFVTKNMKNPKTWPGPRNCYRNLINCRDNEHYEQVETTH